MGTNNAADPPRPRPTIERRDVLHGLALAGGLAATGFGLAGCSSAGPSTPAAGPEPQNEPGYYPPTRTGMRGSHDGSYEAAHAVRDGMLAPEDVADTGETYDLVIVGGGLSGLAAARFLQQERPAARILVLENHDDFGGHAKRNEFTVNGKTLLLNGGTMLIGSPRPYSAEAAGLLAELGIDAAALAQQYRNSTALDGLGLGNALFFDRQTFGRDQLLPMPGRNGDRAAYAAAFRNSPLSEKAQADALRLLFDSVDYLPGLSEADKRQRLAHMSYLDYMQKLVKMDEAAINLFKKRTYGEWGVEIDAWPALDCWGDGQPGFEGLGLSRGDTTWMGNTAAGYSSTGGSPAFHFPDGNATIARALVRQLVPAVAPAGTIESIVLQPFDYSQLDRPGQPVRIRLNSIVIRVRPNEQGADILYVNGPQQRMVRGKAVVLACYNMMIPYLLPELPAAQKEALHQMVKVPLVYASVAIRNLSAFDKLKVQRIDCPGMYFPSISLSNTSHIGGYQGPAAVGDPALIFLSRGYSQPGLPTVRDQCRAGRQELLGTSFETFEAAITDQLNRVLGPGGFDAARDIAGIMVNRWPHGYAYEYNTLDDPWNIPEEKRPNVIGRQRFGRIAIANSDAGATAYTDGAIDQAHRAIGELLDSGAFGAG